MNSQNQSPEQLLTIGSVIDKNYRVKRRTRFTEKSEIYKVNDIKLGRTVAIKMLRPGQEEERKNQFSEEYKTLAKLDGIRKHPNIITIHAAGEYHGNPYMVMEYIEGDDLDELLEANRTFSLEKILRIEEELCQALTKAHSEGLKHRDIKPGNIRIRKDESVKNTACLVDFGARLTKHETKEDNGPPKNDVIATGLILEQLLENRENPEKEIPERLEEVLNNTKQGNYKTPEDLRKALVDYRKGITRRKFIKWGGAITGLVTTATTTIIFGKKYHSYLNSLEYIIDELKQTSNPKETQSLLKELNLRIFNKKIRKLIEEGIIPRGKFPYATSDEGKEWTLTDGTCWTSGFWPGILWQGFKATQNSEFKDWAYQWADTVDFTDRDWTNLNSNRFYYSHALGSEITKDERLKKTALKESQILTQRFNEQAESFPQHGIKLQNLYIDTMTTAIPLLTWTYSQTKDEKLKSKIDRHCNAIIKYNINPDGSTVQVRIIDPSKPDQLIGDRSHGFNEESCLSRGQARAIKGFMTAYNTTGEPLYLETAIKCEDYSKRNTPSDKVPFYDFKDPNRPIPKDTSAAAIGASGLLDLFEITQEQSYKLTTLEILKSLAINHLSLEEEHQGILLNQCSNYNTGANINCSLICGGYHFLEALTNL